MDFITILGKLIADVTDTQKSTDLDHMLMLATSCKAAIKNAKSHLFDPAKRKVALQQLQFSDRIISGIAEALRREQTGVQIEDHLANILVGLTRLKKELSSGTAAPTPMPTPTEDLKGSDWMSALRQIRTRLEDGVVQEQIKNHVAAG
jgi:hypothetical protein